MVVRHGKLLGRDRMSSATERRDCATANENVPRLSREALRPATDLLQTDQETRQNTPKPVSNKSQHLKACNGTSL